MKTFKVKNYKGNLVESLSKFQKSHKGMKIVEAVEDGKDLKIQAEGQYDYEPPNPELNDIIKTITNAFKEYAAWFNDVLLDPQNENDYKSFIKALRDLANILNECPDVSNSSFANIDYAIDKLEVQYNDYQDYWKDK